MAPLSLAPHLPISRPTTLSEQLLQDVPVHKHILLLHGTTNFLSSTGFDDGGTGLAQQLHLHHVGRRLQAA